jgi:hypothetical protein
MKLESTTRNALETRESGQVESPKIEIKTKKHTYRYVWKMLYVVTMRKAMEQGHGTTETGPKRTAAAQN